MKRNLICSLGIAAICISLLAAAPHSGKTADAPQKFNLADLADGESRTFGQGDHAVTATRKGDEVTLTFPGDKGEKTLHCTVGKDSCSVMTVDDQGKTQVVVLRRTDQADEDADTFVLTADADDSGNVVVHGTGPDVAVATADVTESAPGVKVIRIVADAGTVLRCPEGDATLTLKKGEEKTGPYFCPRHNLKMEPSKDPVVMKKVKIEKSSKPKDEQKNQEY